MFYTYFLQKVDSLFYFYYKSLFLFICIYDTTAINPSASTAITTSNSPVWGNFVLLCVLSTVIVFSTTSMSLVTFPITIVFSTVLFLSSFLLSSSFLSSSFLSSSGTTVPVTENFNVWSSNFTVSSATDDKLVNLISVSWLFKFVFTFNLIIPITWFLLVPVFIVAKNVPFFAVSSSL